jgi:hypothetical protein
MILSVRHRPRSRNMVVVLAATWLGGCDGPDDRLLLQEQPVAQSQALIFKAGELWTNAPSAIQKNPLIIPVCWEDYTDVADNGILVTSHPDTGNSGLRDWTRDAVEGTWQRYARINFTGWGTCTPSSHGIRIFIDRPTACSCVPGARNACIQDNCPCPTGGEGAYCGGTGTPLGGNTGPLAADGLQGWRAFYDASGNIRRATTAKANQSGMRLNPLIDTREGVYETAVHEFGHALGFYHEHQRPGSPAPCPDVNVGASQTGLSKFGAFDNSSVMSNCNDTPWGLLPGDIMAVQRAYGRKASGSFVSRLGYCLSANSLDTSPFLWSCDEQNQKWTRLPEDSYFLRFPSGDRCVGWPSGGAPANGTSARMNACSFVNKTWNATMVEVRGVGGKCLTFQPNGARLQVQRCASENVTSWNPATGFDQNQKWNIEPVWNSRLGRNVNRIRWNGNTNLCMRVNATSNEATVITGNCFTSENQQFTFLNDGTIRNVASGRCLNVIGPQDSWYRAGNDGPGHMVQLYDCQSGTDMNQQWNFTGQFRNLGKCLDRPGGNDGRNVIPQAFDCVADIDNPSSPGFMGGGPDTGNHRGQLWDYYFRDTP